ncbi:MAG: DUF6603 domain-containing protein [Chitinophagaceae bacterium]
MAEDKSQLSFLITGKTSVGKQGLLFNISIGARFDGTEKQTYASLSAVNGGIGLADLVKAFKSDFDASTIPECLGALPAFKSFYIFYGTGAKSSQFKLELETQLTIGERTLDITLTYDSATDKKENKASAFGGRLAMGAHEFDLKFLSATINNQQTSYLFAQYNHAGTTGISLKDISGRILSPSLAEQVPDISIDLKDFTAFLLYSKTGNSGNVLFGMGAGVEFSLNDLPLVGEVMEKEKSFGIKQVMLTLSYGAFGHDELKALAETVKGLPVDAVTPAKHFGVSLLMQVGETEAYYSLLPDTSSQTEAVKSTTKDYTPLPGSVSGKAKWIKLARQLGPVDLQRIGIGYINKRLVLLLDAGITVSMLSIQLKGLGLGFELKWPIRTPAFYIDGLGLSFKKDPIEISGLFIRVDPKSGEQFSFYGAAKLSTAKFGIAGIGAYSKLQDNKISFFIYAMYNGPIGGPAFFFVTGIAAGFGYNRRIKVPAIDKVRNFPLVSMALNPDPDKGLDAIVSELINNNWIPSSPGDYWLAVGIRFNSFKLIDSFVLVTVQFGTRVEFALLGLSVLKWPAQGNAIAYVELAIAVRFGQGSDVIAVDAMITHNSYVLDKNCKLTGGFAFYVWTAGGHEGDFVITLGGYHPRFKVPSHYPRVDRLGLTWKLSDMLSIHGEMYFALTPTAIMAGGRWEVEYNLSFIRASLTLWADMIISWAPFYYEINAGIRIAIEANIKIAFVRVHFSLEMGAELHIWGPSFAGEVYVDWTIFSFTIPFGDHKKQLPDPLNWKEFTGSFIPEKKQQHSNAVETQPLETRISGGVIKQYKDADGNTVTIANPYELVLTVETIIPVKQFGVKDQSNAFSAVDSNTLMETGDSQMFTTYGQRNTSMGIKSMDMRELDSTLQSWVEKKSGANAWNVQPMNVMCSAKGVADALWGPEKPLPASQVPEAKIIKDAMTGAQFHAREQPETPPFVEKNIENDFQNLIIKKDKLVSFPVNSDALINDKTKIREIISKNLNKQQRLSVGAALNQLGFGLYSTSEMETNKFTGDADIEFLEIPFLARPGSNIPVPVKPS